MAERRDSIIGCAALLREAERRCDEVFDRWSRANIRFSELLFIQTGSLPVGTSNSEFKLSPDTVIEQARTDAVSFYEALLDAQIHKTQIAGHLLHLRSIRRERASPFKDRVRAKAPKTQTPIALPPPRKPNPGGKPNETA